MVLADDGRGVGPQVTQLRGVLLLLKLSVSADECDSMRVWQLARKAHWRLLGENQEKESDREQTDVRAQARKANQAKHRQKKRNMKLEREPQQLEQGILRCPRHAA